MCNTDLRNEMRIADVRQWEVAEAVGVSEMTMVKWLRKELDEEKKALVRSGIAKAVATHNAFESITLPDIVTTLDDSAFRKCINLKEIVIPATVTKIGDAAFLECSALNAVSMPDSVATVGKSVFFYNDDLTITIRKNSGAIAGGLLEMQGMHHVVIEPAITAIGNSAFASCYSLETITYGDETVESGEYKFSSALKTIGSEAFKDNPILRSFVIPDTIESIGTNAFYNAVQSGYHCKDVTVTFYYVNGVIAEGILCSQYVWHVVINDYIHTLSDSAFNNCPVLETISIPDTVSSVGTYVFHAPNKGITAEFRGVDGTIDASVYDGKTTGIHYVVIDENVDTIGAYAFANSATVIGVVITDADSIGNHAFYQGQKLNYVEIAVCDTIDDYAFAENLVLKCVELDSAKNINNYAFYNDLAINDIYIDSDLYHIGDHAFDSCKSIPGVMLPETVREIGAYAFYDCNSMQTINVPSGVQTINDYTFFGCASLIDIDLPDTVTTVGDYAYYGCVVAKDLSLGNAVTSIGAYAFYNCNQVNEIVLPLTLQSIGDYAFRSCSSITEICIPDNVTSLGDCVFYACTSLEQAEFGVGITKIGNSEFYGCVAFEKLVLNGAVDYIHDLAFYGAEDTVIYSFENQYVQDYCSDNSLEYHELANDFTMTVTAPTKTEYIEFEELDLTGLVLNITYTNGIERVITTGYTVSGYDPITLGKQTVTVTYKEVSGTFDVNVSVDGSHTHHYSGTEEIIKKASCTEEGSKKVYCSESGCKAYEIVTIEKSEHEYGEWQVTTPATTESEGVKTRCCQHCTAFETETIEKLAKEHIHNFSGTEVIIKDASCSEEGSKKVYCVGEDCDEYEIVSIQKTAHEYGQWQITTPATTETEGVKTRYCQHCPAYETGSIAKIGEEHVHDFTGTELIVKNPSCTEEGNKKIYCLDPDCGEYTTVAIPMIDHTMVDTVTAPTPTTQGYTTHRCSVCGHSFVDTYTDYIEDHSAKIVIESKKIVKGEEFTIVVTVENNPGFSYLELTPSYSAELTLVSVTNGELISDLTQGKQYIWSADSNVTSDGNLMTFKFSTPDDIEAGEYEVKFVVRSCVNYDESAVDICVENGTIEVIDFIYGDANGDGVINGQDVVRLKKYLANYDYETETSSIEICAGADANGDGVINGQDVVRLKKYLANYDYDTKTSTIILGPQK